MAIEPEGPANMQQAFQPIPAEMGVALVTMVLAVGQVAPAMLHDPGAKGIEPDEDQTHAKANRSRASGSPGASRRFGFAPGHSGMPVGLTH